MTRIAAIQMTSSADVARNLADAWRLLRDAQSQGAVVATLPENFAFMGRAETDKLAVAEADGEGPIQRFIATAARELGLWIVAVGVISVFAGAPANTLVFGFGAGGGMLAVGAWELLRRDR